MLWRRLAHGLEGFVLALERDVAGRMRQEVQVIAPGRIEMGRLYDGRRAHMNVGRRLWNLVWLDVHGVCQLQHSVLVMMGRRPDCGCCRCGRHIPAIAVIPWMLCSIGRILCRMYQSLMSHEKVATAGHQSSLLLTGAAGK